MVASRRAASATRLTYAASPIGSVSPSPFSQGGHGPPGGGGSGVDCAGAGHVSRRVLRWRHQVQRWSLPAACRTCCHFRRSENSQLLPPLCSLPPAVCPPHARRLVTISKDGAQRRLITPEEHPGGRGALCIALCTGSAGGGQWGESSRQRLDRVYSRKASVPPAPFPPSADRCASPSTSLQCSGMSCPRQRAWLFEAADGTELSLPASNASSALLPVPCCPL